MTATRRVIVLGATGSVGTMTLDTIAHLNGMSDKGECPVRFDVVALAAGTPSTRLRDQAARFDARTVAIACTKTPPPMEGVDVRHGCDAVEDLVRSVECDMVVCAIVGDAGLPSTLAAAQCGRDIVLANKESLVAAGSLIVQACRQSGARILPVDSEHAAAWQCLAGVAPGDAPPMRAHVARLVLTASGGPFLARSAEACYDAPVDEALHHPVWRMGPKNTIDSASLMNKALELIEAHHLFGLGAEHLDVLIHPQSVVHAIVELEDRSMIAQMASPDMRLPIQQALTHPHRVRSCTASADLESGLSFENPDPERWPALGLARRAINAGAGAGAVLSAANEAGVNLYLHADGPRIPFGRIVELVREAMDEFGAPALNTLADALAIGAEARAFVRGRAGERARTSE